MKKAKVFSAVINGVGNQVKAYRKGNAVKRFQEQDPDLRAKDVKWAKWAHNSHQAPIDEPID